MSMSINIPICFFSTGFLLALYSLENSNANANADINVNTSTTVAWTLKLTLTFAWIAKILCWIPILATIGVILFEVGDQGNRRNYPLYDSDGTILTPNSKKHLSFLPDKDHCSKDKYESKLKQINTETKRISTPMSRSTTSEVGVPHANASWALVTGSSQGIGRAICVSLARRNISMVIVARNLTKLNALADELMENYSVMVIPMRCDLSQPTSIDDLIQKLRTMTRNSGDKDAETILDKIDILINNAGLGNSSDFFDTETDVMEQSTHKLVSLNILAVTKLTQIIGKHMKHNGRRATGARIVFVSSFMGFMPGVPGSAVYAATKAYQRSLCASLGNELAEHQNASTRKVKVVCVLPGAVAQTGFAKASQMTESAIFHLLPGWGLTLTPYQVAEATVKATISGTHREVHIGWFYSLGATLVQMLPAALIVTMAGLTTGHKKAFQFESTIGKILSNAILSHRDGNQMETGGDEKNKDN